MVFSGKELKDISKSDILYLIDEKYPEETTLEYKREPWKNDTAGREELLKDVSAMANNQGGFIIIGINTIKDSIGRDIPQGTFCSIKKPHQTAQSILDKCKKYIDPRIQGIDTHLIPINQNGTHNILLIYIPVSEIRPHAYLTDRGTIFVQRQGHGIIPLSVHEIETLRSASAIPKLTDFMEEVQLKLGRLESKLDGVLSFNSAKTSGDLSEITDPNQLLNLSRDKFIGEE